MAILVKYVYLLQSLSNPKKRYTGVNRELLADLCRLLGVSNL